jgi:putative protein-disulfide isomerase
MEYRNRPIRDSPAYLTAVCVLISMDPDLELIYVGDPMCSWCWGFAPVLEQLDRRFDMPLRVVAGGLRPGPAAAEMDDAMHQMLLHHWTQVEAATGQPFDQKALNREGWRYDTMIPDTAVVTMRHIDETKTLPFFTTLQRAFYADGIDITDRAVYSAMVQRFDVDPVEFVARLGSERMHNATIADFSAAQRLGVTGFPTLLLRDGGQTYIVTRGYAPFDPIHEGLSAFLAEHYPLAVSALVCDLDGDPC